MIITSSQFPCNASCEVFGPELGPWVVKWLGGHSSTVIGDAVRRRSSPLPHLPGGERRRTPLLLHLPLIKRALCRGGG
jgi:hypothetical protein